MTVLKLRTDFFVSSVILALTSFFFFNTRRAVGATDKKYFYVRTMRGVVDIGGMKFGIKKL